jgi:hypothetical protein
MPRTEKTLYYFAVGGTGALSVEPLLHLCAAGLGPRRLSVMLIDPDTASPAITRAERLLRLYANVRQAFGKPTDGFFSTELIRTKRSEQVWSPLGDDPAFAASMSLELFTERGRMVGPNQLAGTMMDLLFSIEQQKEQLHEGFRGNPAIGSILMHGLKESTFFKDLMAAARGDTTAAFFATGSIFGGTGAAALPVLAEILRGEGIAQARLGAAMVTPYYALPEPSQRDSQDGRLKPDSSVFLRNTAAALPLYVQNHSKYGTLYALGDASSIPHPRRTFVAGGGQIPQSDPHAVEFFSALAAVDFVSRERDPRPATRMFYMTLGGEHPGWRDLPLNEDDRSHLHHFVVASNFFLHYFGSSRSKKREADIIAELSLQTFPKDFGLKPEFVRTHAAALDLLGEYFVAAWGYLWATTHNKVPLMLASFADESGTSVPLPSEYASRETQDEATIPPVDRCLAGYSPKRTPKKLGLFGGGAEQRLGSLAEMFNWWNQVRRDDLKELAGFLAYLHDGTRRFVTEWYSPSTDSA